MWLTLTEHFLGLVRHDTVGMEHTPAFAKSLQGCKTKRVLKACWTFRIRIWVFTVPAQIYKELSAGWRKPVYGPKRFARVLMFQYYWTEISVLFNLSCVWSQSLCRVSGSFAVARQNSAMATVTAYTEMSSKHKKVQKNAYLLWHRHTNECFLFRPTSPTSNPLRCNIQHQSVELPLMWASHCPCRPLLWLPEP